MSPVNSKLQKVPKGYRQTELGVIPEDWAVVTLADLSERIMVGIASAATHAYRERGIPLLRNQNIKPNFLDDNDVLFITKEYEALFKNKRLKSGDLLTARTGYPGTTCLIPKKYEDAQSFTTLITRPNKNASVSEYICFYMNSEAGEKFFELNQIGGGQKNVNASILRTMPLPLPKKNEQTAIANALSDVDALITSLEKLIDKKRAIKTAAMQQLLTGKKRLPPFDKINGKEARARYKQTELGEIPDDWEVKPIGSALSIRHGRDQKEVETQDGIYPIMGTGGEIGRTNTFLFDKPSVLIGRKGTINKPVYMETPFWTVDTLFYSEVSEKFSGKFIYYKFCLIDWMAYNEASGVPSLNASTIERILQSFPLNKDEQIAIASVISDMDKEITALEQRLNKTQKIKLGMMQELLTGRTRLV